jgi:mono/diheme cytochrome c family protein
MTMFSSKTSRLAFGVIVLAALASSAFFWISHQPALAPIEPVARNTFDPALVRRGATLAALGDCNTCHTAPGGNAFAGGLALPTPFGTIYSTNITADPETGIGRWSESAFHRAMREGVDRSGRHLYPAFPYDHFALVSDDDNRAIYAFLMTRTAVHAEPPQNQLMFPLGFRPLLAGWKLMFMRGGPFVSDPTHDEIWNRGAYLVQGLGHCGACHTPRNLLGAEKGDLAFGGGVAEGWHAFTINGASPSPVPWDADSLYAYLRRGWHGMHGVARGPMEPVTDNLATVSDSDVWAIATYVAFLMGNPSQERRQEGEALAKVAARSGIGSKPQSAGSQTTPPVASNDPGAAIYAATCAACHESGRPVPYGGIRLLLSTAVSADSPRNLINVILTGLPATPGQRAPIMPGFAAALDDQQMIALTSYLRATFTRKAPWHDVATELRDARNAQVADEHGGRAPPGTVH